MNDGSKTQGESVSHGSLGGCRLGSECRMPISGCHIQWLALHAFVRVLGRKRSRYTPVLAALQAEMRSEHFARLPSQLAAIVDPKRSPAFDSILY